MAPRRFLLITYCYPPHGGGGVQRALHLSRIARDLGWEPVVLACAEAGTTTMDPSLVDKIPPDIHVERTRAILIHRAHAMLSKVGLGPLIRFIPVDYYVGWFPFAWHRAKQILQREPIDLIFSTSAPYTAHLIGYCARRMLNCPWVADLRDPWTDNRFVHLFRANDWISKLRRPFDQRVEQSVYALADAITVTAAPLRTLLIGKHRLSPDQVHLIPNGFDADDFSEPWQPPSPPRPVFRLLFAGSMYSDYNISSVFRAADLLLSRRELPGFQFSIITPAFEWAKRETDQYRHLRKTLTIEKAVTHHEVLARYRDADALVLCALDPLSTPGKLFEYIAAGPPVLAFVVPGTDAETFIKRTGAGEVIAENNVEAGAQAIERAYEHWKLGLRTPRDEGEITKLSRQVQMQAMVSLFNQLVASHV